MLPSPPDKRRSALSLASHRVFQPSCRTKRTPHYRQVVNTDMSSTETLSKTSLQPLSMCEPPRFSDWNALSKDERRSCVSQHCLLGFEPTDDWTHAWLPDGLLKQHWEEELLTMCKAVIDCPENRKLLRKKYADRKNRSYPLHVRLLMLTKSENRDMACPVVVFEHPDTR